MQGAKDKVSGFSCGKSQRNGFLVTHFTDQNNVGIFPQG